MASYPNRSLLLVALGHLTIELCNNFLPVVYPVLDGTLGLNYTQIGMVALVAGMGSSLVQPLFGYLSDRWAPQWIIILSVAWIGVVMGLVGTVWSYPALVLMVGLGTLGSAAFHPSGAIMASTGDGARRGAAVSVFSVGGSVGAALSPLWVSTGMRWLGSRGTLVVIPISLLVALLLYRRLGRVTRPVYDQSATNQGEGGSGTLVGLTLIIMAVVFRMWFQVTFTTYLPAWVQGQGRSLAAGGEALSVFLALSGVGSLIGGPLSDRVGRWRVLALSLGLLGPAVWLFVVLPYPIQVVLTGVMGMLIGASFPVTIVMAQEAWPHGLGMASGLVMGLPWVAGGVGASLTGLAADHLSLQAAFLSLVVPGVLGAVCSLAYAGVRGRAIGGA